MLIELPFVLDFVVYPRFRCCENESRLISTTSRLSSRLLDKPRLLDFHSRSTSTLSSGRATLAFHGATQSSLITGFLTRRGVVRYSKNKGKMKSVKAVVKRFKRTAHGKLKRWRANCHHYSLRKNRKQRKKNKKGVFVTDPQLKLLNKMLSNR